MTDQPTGQDYQLIWDRLPDWAQAELAGRPGAHHKQELLDAVHQASTGIIVEPTSSNVAGVSINFIDEGFTQWMVAARPLPRLDQWWTRLRPGTRDRLQSEPDGPVPSDLVAEVVAAGQFVMGAYWPSTSTGPASFELPESVKQWIAKKNGPQESA